MKNHSIFQVLLIAVFGALALAGILVFAFAVGGGGGGASIGKVVIWGTFDKNTVNAVLEQAASYNPQLQQVAYVQKDAGTFQQDLAQALAEGSGPDMIILSSDYAVKDTPELSVIPYSQFSQVQFENRFVAAGAPFLGKDGIVGLPFLVDPLVLYWNKDLLSQAGFAVPPATWDPSAGCAAFCNDMLSMVQKIAVRDSSGAIQTAGIALGTFQNIENAKDVLALLLEQQGVQITTRGSTGTLTPAFTAGAGNSDVPAVAALGFYTSFADPSQPHYSWSGAMQSARAAFAAGTSAFYIGYASEFPTILSMNPNLDFAAAPIPQFSGATRQVDFGRSYAFAVPKGSKNPGGASVAAALLDTASTSAAFSKALGIPSALRDALAMPSSGYEQLFNNMALITRIWSDPDPVETSGMFQAMIEQTISGALPASQALSRGAQQLTQILSSQ